MEISAKSLKTLIEYCRYPAAIFDLELNLIVSNAVFNYNFQFNVEDCHLKLKGKSGVYNFITEDDVNLKNIFNQVEKEEYSIIMGGLLVSIKSLENENKKMFGWIFTIKQSFDVGENKYLTLKDQENKFHFLADYMPQIVWITNRDGCLDYCNKRWEEYKDYGWIESIHPDDRQELLKVWNEAVREVKMYQHIGRFWSKEKNDYIYCMARASPLLDDNNHLIKWLGSCLDIHQQKQTEQALQEVTEQLNLALRSANIGIWNRDLISETVVWDSTMYELYGIDKSAHPTDYQAFISLLHPLDQKQITEKVRYLKKSETNNFDLEFRVIWKDGSIHVLSSRGKIYRDKNGKPSNMIGICMDVTDFKLAQQLLHHNQLELEKEEKASTVAEIASTLAHELTQPLAAITTFTQGCIEQLKQEHFDLEDIIYALTESSKQAERTGEIIHRIKNSVRKKALYIESVNLIRLIEESIQFATYGINKINISINYYVCNSLPSVQMDKIQIQQVLINLIRNSIEALEDFKKVNSEIIVSGFLINERYLAIEVIDNGPGFSEVHLQDLECFDSTKDGGMGIGLSICRNIVETHGGKLNLSNIPQGGAAVQFTLPIIME